MNFCPCCGSPPPAPHRIVPLGMMGEHPRIIILWNCCGERRGVVDQDLLQRFGVIAGVPWSCGTTRATEWQKTTPELRYRAALQEQLRWALAGMM